MRALSVKWLERFLSWLVVLVRFVVLPVALVWALIYATAPKL